jgi:hypothetical protein
LQSTRCRDSGKGSGYGKSNVKPILDNYHTLTPYLIVEGVAMLIDFLKEAFETKETREGQL